MNSMDGLSKRARRALTSLNCGRIEDAARLGESDLLRCADVGPKTLREIKDRLDRLGLKLAESGGTRLRGRFHHYP